MRPVLRSLFQLTAAVCVCLPILAAAQDPPTISAGGRAGRVARATAAAVVGNSFVKTIENGQQCTTITFEGLADQAPVPAIEGINSPGWLSLIDFDAGGNGNFANEPSPETIMFWLGNDPSIVLDRPASRIEFFYSTSVNLTVTAFDAAGTQIAQISRPANFSGGPGDPTGQYSVWAPLTVEAPGKKIKSLQVVGGPNFTGFDDLKVCGSLGVGSVELTQAIQQLQSLDELKADLQDDREAPVPIVAGKPAALRVYLGEVPSVTQVTVDVTGAVTGSKTVSLQPQCTVEKQRLEAGGCAGANFFFTPPAGDFDLTVTVRDATGAVTDTQELPFTARTTNSLRLKAVSICDAKDASGSWLCASASDLAGRAGMLRRIAPTASVSVQTTASQVRRETAAFAIVRDWERATLGDVANLFNIFDSVSDVLGTTVKYYGMFRPAVPGGTGGIAHRPGTGGMSRPSVRRLGVETASETVAHEVGHTLGLAHTIGNNPASTTVPPGCYNTPAGGSDWPFADNRIQSASGLEVGFDVIARRPLDPRVTFDIMSYCVPRWISPRRYKSMITGLSGGDVTSASRTAAAAAMAVPAWLVSGTLVDGGVQFDPLFALDGTLAPDEGSHRIEVLNASGGVVASQSFTPSVADAETIDTRAPGPPQFSVLVPRPEGAARIVVRSATNEVVGIVTLGGAAPSVQALSPGPPTQLAGVVPLAWIIGDADSGRHTTRVHYSADGVTWAEIGVTDTNELLVDFDNLPGGAAASIRLLVSDGVNTTTATFGPYASPRKSAVSAAILSPGNDTVVQPGVLFLEGAGIDVDDGTLTAGALEWSSDAAGLLGTGELLGVELAFGPHRIQLRATDSDGNVGTAEMNLLVAGAAPLVDLTIEALDTLPTTCVAATIGVTALGLAPTLVEYSLDGGQTWTTVPIPSLPARFIVPGSGFFHLIARAFDAAGQSTADGEQFFTSAACNQQADLTPPTVTPTLAGTLGNNGWYVGTVTVSWQLEDPESGISDSTGCAVTTVATDTAGTTLTCTATNGAGLSTTQSVTVRLDKTVPVFGAAADVIAEATGAAGAPVTFVVPVASDANPVSATTCAPASGGTFPLGVSTVVCNAVDEAGNRGAVAFSVTVRDTTAPAITVPSEVVAPAQPPAGAVVTFVATAVDLVSGTVAVTCTPPSGSTFPLGSTTVTCTAADAAGNAATARLTVTVTDTLVPGLMLGLGQAERDGTRYTYGFFAGQLASGFGTGSFDLQVCAGAPRRGGHDYGRCINDGRRGVGGRGSSGPDRFDSTAVTFIRFSNDPNFSPGRSPAQQALADTVVIGGRGRWNGQPNYSFEAVLTDRGEPGRGRDTVKVTITDPGGVVVALLEPTSLQSGENESVRLPSPWNLHKLEEMRLRTKRSELK